MKVILLGWRRQVIPPSIRRLWENSNGYSVRVERRFPGAPTERRCILFFDGCWVCRASTLKALLIEYVTMRVEGTAPTWLP